ncbi:hypothetical protein ACYJ1Y_15535 [Natrialbaceae archaeon A-gly3]
MVLSQLLVILPLAVVTVGVLPFLVYRDARQVDITRPTLWAGGVAATSLAGIVALLIPFVPLPGALVFFMMGPVFYLFERDDAKHGDERADPHSLPNTGDSSGSDDGESEDG